MKIEISKEQPSLEKWLWVDNFNNCVDWKKLSLVKKWLNKRWLKRNNITAHLFNIGADECGIFESEHNIFVVCSGSDKDREEWRGNFDAYPPFRKANINPAFIKGYHYNYFEVAEWLFNYAKEYIGKTEKPIIDVGRSRGCLVDIGTQIHCSTVKEEPVNRMAMTYDGIRLAREDRIEEFEETCITEHIHHRCETFASITAHVPPAIFGWRHSETTLLKLPNVWGFNHINIGKAIKRAIKIRDR